MSRLTLSSTTYLSETEQTPTIEANSYPLTPLQQGLLFQVWRDPDAVSYEIQVHWTIKQAVDLVQFQQAWQVLIKRHPILRTSIRWEGLDEPRQWVQSTVDFSLRFIDWGGKDVEEQVSNWQTLLSSDQQEKIDLTKAPQFRVVLVKFSDTNYKVIWHTHHMLLDGWSISLILSDLAKIYHDPSEQYLVKALPFSEYVSWLSHQDWLTTQTFWQRYLSKFSEPTPLMITHTSLANHNATHAYQFQMIQLTPEQTKIINQFAKQEAMSLNSLFQTLWGIILYRYSQANDVVFGTVLSGRSIPLNDMDTRLGLFINTIPLRLQFNATLSTRDCLQRYQKSFIDKLPHSQAPLTQIHSWSELNDSELPLFHSITVFENYPACSPLFEEISFWDPTHYPLTFIITPGEKISLKIGYDASLIHARLIDNLLCHMHDLLLQMIAEPDKPVSSLLLGVSPTLKLPQEIKSVTPIQLFEEQAKKFPHQIAIVFNHETVTYQSLNHRASQLVWHLKEKKVEVGVPVACYLKQSIDWVTCLLAIWKVGGVYVPVDPNYPAARIKLILSNSQATFFLTNKALYTRDLDKGIFQGLECIITDSPDGHDVKENFVSVAKPNNLSYILYTSGTTTLPKGVAQEHKTLANLALWQQSSFSISKKQKITQLASINFDVSLQEITYALCNGHKLYLVEQSLRSSLTKLVDFIDEQGITQIFLPTALLEPFCEAGLLTKNNLLALTDIFVSGEALKITSLIKRFFEHRPHCQLTNQYGPTETHVASFYKLPQDTHTWEVYPPIGKAIDNIALCVLDKNQQLVPNGVPGELYIGGVGIARHYINNPEQTKRSFFETLPPFKTSLKFYKTGDKVRWNECEELEYLGRFDDQLKIRGYRIEPAEIESILLKQPGIRQCIVIGKVDHTGALQLVCYLVREDKVSLDIEELRQLLESKLPDYMIPQHMVILNEFPMTSNGKIDKAALPAPVLRRTSDVCHLPRNNYEKTLLTLWVDILDIKNCGIEDNFFALGGHSLKVLQLLLKIEKIFNVRLGVNDVHSAPTITKLSERIQQLQANHFVTDEKLILYKGKEIPFPIMTLQAKGKKTPLFLIHPVGGTVFWFIELARCLGTERPIYGIQDPSIFSQTIFFDSIEEIATYYLHCIRQIQPSGPYCIAGASFGATVAFDIGKQLKEDEIGMIGLLDGWAYYPIALQQKNKFNRLMKRQIEDLSHRFKIEKIAETNRWIDLQWHRNELLWRYSLSPLNAKLVLFKAKEVYKELSWADEPANYWREYSTYPIEIHLIPGDHETIFKQPNVQILATGIKNYLNRTHVDKSREEHDKILPLEKI